METNLEDMCRHGEPNTDPIIPPKVDAPIFWKWRELFDEVDRFQKETFPRAPITAWLEHLKEECQELLDDPGNPEEKADVIMLAFGVLSRLCSDLANLDAVRAKLEINKSRTWLRDDNGNYRHVGGE